MKATISNGLTVGMFALALLGCESTDPGLEEEISKLRQENSSLNDRLQIAERTAKEAASSASEATTEARQQLEQAQAALKELESRFDRKRLEASFAAAVSDFKEETLKKFPGNSISQVTLHEMVMPSDHPFSSGVTMVLNDSSSGASRTIHVKALGNIEGEWTFKKVDAGAMAANRPETGAPPVTPPPTQGAASPSAGQTPAAPVIKRTNSNSPAPSSGKVYQIDWGD